MSPAVLDRGQVAPDRSRPGAGRGSAGVGGPWRGGLGPMRRDAPAAPPADAGRGGGEVAAKAAVVGGRATLEDVLSDAWEGLVAHRSAACPVCGGQMTPRYGAAGAAPVGGRCRDCGSVLG